MTTIHFVTADGARTSVNAKDGDSIMQTALANGIDAIVAECGGSMMCATCHIYVDYEWSEEIGTAPDDESAMLDFAACPIKKTSRLSCQIRVTPALDGLIVHLPEAQI